MRGDRAKQDRAEDQARSLIPRLSDEQHLYASGAGRRFRRPASFVLSSCSNDRDAQICIWLHQRIGDVLLRYDATHFGDAQDQIG